MDELEMTANKEQRSALLRRAQEMIATDYVNAYLFQLAKTGVARAGLEGLWANAPTQANDLTQVRWTE
jgi:peptide/nickel transport system substrate-binding protein